jgi:hypothetical protein
MQRKGGYSPVLGLLQRARALRWVGRLQVEEQEFCGGEVFQSEQVGYLTRDWKALILDSPAVTASAPTIAVIWDPLLAKFVGQALALIAMTGHAVVKIFISAHFDLGGIL